MYKITILSIIALLLFCQIGYAQDYLIDDYKIVLEDRDDLIRDPNENNFYSKITIFQKDKLLFTAKGWSILLNIRNKQLILEDITGGGKDNLIVKIWEGGDCCYSHYILQLGSQFRVIHKFNSVKNGIILKKMPENLSYSIIVSDMSYYNFYVAGYMSNRPELIFNYQGGDYVVDIEAMRKPKLSERELQELIIEINHELDEIKSDLDKAIFESDDENYEDIFDQAVMAPVIYKALDLIYGGNAEQALILIDKTWIAKKISKERFVKDLRRKIAGSPYGKEIIKLNGHVLDIGWCN